MGQPKGLTTANHVFTYIDGHDAPCTASCHTLFDDVGRTEQYGTHIVLLQIHGHSHQPVVKFEQFARFRVRQPAQSSHAVAHLEHLTHLLVLHGEVNALQLPKEYFRYFTWFDIFHILEGCC